MKKLVRRTVVTLSVMLLITSVALCARGRWAYGSLHFTFDVGAGPDAATQSVGAAWYRNGLELVRQRAAFQFADFAEEAGFRHGLSERHGLTRTTLPPRQYQRTAGDGRGGEAAGFVWERVGSDDSSLTWRMDLEGHSYAITRCSSDSVVVPWWFLIAVSAAAPAWACRAWLRRARRRPSQCRGCGYDVRATADEAGPLLAACPECGRASGAAERGPDACDLK